MAPKRTTRSTPVTPAPTATTTTVTKAQLQALIDQGVATALAEVEASRVRNGYGSNGSGPRLAKIVRECTYPDFLKCQPLNFKGTEGVIGLTQWSRSYMVELICEDCYSGSCSGISMENFKEMMTDKVEKYTIGVPDTIHDSVKATKPKTMQEAIEFATELMDKRIRDAVENKQKFKGTSGNNQSQPQQNKRQNTGRAYAAGNSDRNMYTGPKPLCSKCDYHHEGPCLPRAYAERQVDNKIKSEDIARNNQNQQPYKRQNTGQVYTAGNGDKRLYAGSRPLCPKCNYNHEGPCLPKCNNYKRVGHLTKDCRSRPANNNNNNRNNNNQQGNGCFECGAQTHFKRNCPKLKNNNRGNQARNDRASARVYAVRNAGANPDNVVASTFLLNNHCALILFDTGVDKIFVSTAFSSLININPSTLDCSYDVELANGQILNRHFFEVFPEDLPGLPPTR
nr:hypothetical protein [Tanacetum cinerariifolium]